MRIWNADGGEVEACGNATRCVACCSAARDDRDRRAACSTREPNGDGATVDMGAPRFGWDEIPLAYAMDTAAMPVGWEISRRRSRSMSAIRMSSSSSPMPMRSTSPGSGPLIEHDPLFPERVNVNVASIEDGAIRLRVWERGAGLTRPAAPAPARPRSRRSAAGWSQSPVEVRLPGGALTIAWAPGGTIRMTGPATHVFTGGRLEPA